MRAIDKGMVQEFAKKKKKGGGFQSMDLLPHVFKGVMKMGYKLPTPVQRKSIPIIMEGHDVVAMARTGSGKTAAFCIPLLNKLDNHAAGRASSSLGTLRNVGASSSASNVRAVILSPTRELAMQTHKVLGQLGRFSDLRYCMLIGGQSMEAQFEILSSEPDVIIATPGRLVHHLLEVKFTLTNVKYVVFDEADRLFEMGFSAQLTQILSHMGEDRQTCLFSATMPKALAEFSRAGLRNPVPIRLDTESKISPDLEVSFFTLRSKEKLGALHYLLNEVIPHDQQALVFVATRHHVEFLETILKNSGISSTSIFGHLDAEARKTNIDAFRNKEARVMVVTDLAARGIDIPLLDNVINFDFPAKPKLFIHRAGRVARANQKGTAYSFVSTDEMPYLLDLYLFFGWKMPLLPNDDGTFPLLNTEYPKPEVQEEKMEDKAEAVVPVETPVKPSQENLTRKQRKDAAKKPKQAEATMDDSEAVIQNADEEQTEADAYADEGNPNRLVEIGRFPAPILDSETEYVRGVIDACDLHNLERVTNNGYKMYHKTRESASSASSRRWKDMVMAPIHPIFFRLEAMRASGLITAAKKPKQIKGAKARRAQETEANITAYLNDYVSSSKNTTQSINEMASYDAALQSLSTFTPKQTIFELLQLGDASTMRNKRLEHDRVIIKNSDAGNTQDTRGIMAGMLDDSSDTKKMKKGSLSQMHVDLSTGIVNNPSKPLSISAQAQQQSTLTSTSGDKNTSTQAATRTFMSAAERRKRKRMSAQLTEQGISDKSLIDAMIAEENDREIKKKRGQMTSNQMKDNNYISLATNVNTYEEAGYSINAKALDAAVMDLGPEDHEGLLRSKKVEKWDQRKRRFVTTYEKADAFGKIKKNESGKLIKADKKQEGQMYAEWQRRSKSSVSNAGAASYYGGDDNDTFETEATTGMGSNHNKIMAKRAKLPPKSSQPSLDRMGKKITHGIASIDQVRKQRETTEKNKVRNAKKKK